MYKLARVKAKQALKGIIAIFGIDDGNIKEEQLFLKDKGNYYHAINTDGNTCFRLPKENVIQVEFLEDIELLGEHNAKCSYKKCTKDYR